MTKLNFLKKIVKKHGKKIFFNNKEPELAENQP